MLKWFLSSVMIRAQMLSELEEIIQYKQYADQPERQESMKRMWMKRFVYLIGIKGAVLSFE